ncbi:MAG: calcium/sodium antiporter, partial [Alistipes sp.]|nr:calcium/sodium antiporter [Alistipes sp.]
LTLILAFALIIVGAMWLTDGSVAVASRFKVPEFIVGLTIVAIGTSMPELTVSFMSAIAGKGDMAIGNVVGSNTFNTLLILGVCALCSPLIFTKSNIRRDIPICIVATVALLVVTLINQDISRIEGVVLLAGYVAMIVYMIRAEKRDMLHKEVAGEQVVDEKPKKQMPLWRVPIWILGGLAGLIYGGELFVSSASEIARSWGVSEAVIAITLVAGGTSMPELASSLVSVLKGNASLALGNVLGSNIANILLILGACSTVTPLTMGGVTMGDIYIVVASAFILMLSALIIGRDKLTRIEGLLFIVCYVAYVYTLI